MELGLESLQRGEVHSHLLGKLTGMARPEVSNPRFLRVHPILRFRELDPQKLGGLGRLLLADLRIFLDVQGGERIGDLRDRLRITPPVAEVERDGGTPARHLLRNLPELELDVASHLLDDRLRRHPVPQIRIQGETRDQIVQLPAAHDLLADRLKPGLELTGDGRSDESLGDLVALHEHGGRRSIDVRQGRRDADRAGKRHRKDREHEPPPAAPHLEPQLEHRTPSDVMRHD